jgi:hypothetical protein
MSYSSQDFLFFTTTYSLEQRNYQRTLKKKGIVGSKCASGAFLTHIYAVAIVEPKNNKNHL